MITVDSSKEDVGNFVVTNLKLKEEIKNIIIKEDISGDVLLDLEDKDYKDIGIKVVQMRKIKTYVEQNKEKFGKKLFNEVITINSSPKEVAEFFSRSLNYNKNLNDLNGKSLLELTEESMKNLGLTLGQKKKLIKYIDYFKTLKIEVPEEKDIEINENSTNKEVYDYLKNKLKISDKGIETIKDELGIEGGDTLLLLEETDIDICALSDEEKQNMKEFINKLKGKGEEETLNDKDIVITNDSKKDDIVKFLKIKLNFSEKGINSIVNELGVEDGEAILLLESKDIDEAQDLTEEEKERFKNFLKTINTKEEPEIIITKESSMEDVKQYLNKKLNFSEEGIKAIEDLGVDGGETLLSLQKEDIDNTKEFSKEEKENLKTFLKIEEKTKIENEEKTKIENDKKKIENDKKKIENDKKKIEIKNDEKKFENKISLNDKKNPEKENNKNPKNDNPQIKLLNEIIVGENNNNDIKPKEKKQNNQKKNNINDPLKNKEEKRKEKEEEIINDAYNGDISDKIYISSLEKYQINPLIKDSKFDVFFILSLKEKNIKYTQIGAFVDKTGFFSIKGTFKNFNSYIIYENQFINTKNEKIKSFIFQVPMNKHVEKLSILIINNKNFKEEYTTEINISEKIFYYFYVYNTNNDVSIKNNRIFEYFFDFFFNEKNKINENLQKSLIKSLINKIKYENNIILKPNIILRFFKYCQKFKLEPQNLENIELNKEDKTPLKEEYFILSDDIDSIAFKNVKEKNKIINFLTNIYAYSNEDNLIKLIESKNGTQCSKAMLDLLYNQEIKFEDLAFKNEEQFLLFQKNLLFVSTTKEEINLVNKMSNGLVNNLKFIFQYCKEICNILEKNAGRFKSNDSNYILKVAEPKIEDDITSITDYLTKIFELTNKKAYKIINLEEIFEGLNNLYSDKPLNELCKLNELANLLKTQNIKQNTIENYYSSIHNKGINLIKNGLLNTEEIILFIQKQDVFYYKDNFKKNRNRDPIIFKYIPITPKEGKENDYLKNIELFKKNRLWELYPENGDLQKNFFTIILEQMENLRDYKSIFEIFPIKYFNQTLAFLINGRVKDNIYTLLDEKEEDYELLFDVFNEIIKVNEYNGLDLPYIVQLLQINYNLTSKYYFHILKDEKMSYTVNNIKNLIINFFLERKKEGKLNAESIITLLLLSPRNFCQYLLNQMNNMIVNENDFYQKEESQNFLLFKLFFEKCRDLIEKGKLSDGTYLIESLDMKNKFKEQITNNKIKYDIIKNLIDENNSLYQKIFVVFDEEEGNAKKAYDKIKENMKIVEKKFEQFEIILDYLNTFFSNSKKNVINLIKNSLNKLKQSNINEIINLDENKFIQDNDFNLERLKEESKKLKYKNSSFFMAIYRKKYDNEIIEKSEEDIFLESIDNYQDSLTRIINQKDSKEPFFGIHNVNEIINAVQNNNMDKEIEFILKEFAGLGKDEYIKKELLNDLINFSNKSKVLKLLQGIVYFIESYSKINAIQNTDFLNNLKTTFNTINTNEVSGEEIKKGIDLLNKYDYDIKNETSLMKFYELLLGKEEAIIFIKKIKDSNLEIRNLNEFIDEIDSSQLQTTDIDNLIDVYTFFNKLMGNENIKTDIDLLTNFKIEFNNDKDIPIKLQGYLNTYGEIIQLFQLYDENPEMTIQKINSILDESLVNIYKDNKTDLFIFNVSYKNQNGKIIETPHNEIDELRNKILLSSTTTNSGKKEGEKLDKKMSKEIITNQFVNLFDNIRQLIKTLNSLLVTGYPSVVDFSLKIRESKAFDESDVNKDLEQIINYYKEINKKYKKDLQKGYEDYPFLRLFYGKQLIQLHQKATNKNKDISHLLNSVTLNMIKDTNIDYPYNYEMNSIENINKYLLKLFKNNNIDIELLYKNNEILKDTNLSPGLYRKIRSIDFSDLINNVLNIYLNLTGNLPIINTLLICNENTNFEKIKSFLYRAIFCDKPILFLIANMECLELSVTQKIIRTLKGLYKKKNNVINSYLIFIYEKVDSGLARDIEKLIPEKNILNDKYLIQSENKDASLENIELYYAKYSGFGKTTEIIHKVKDNNGEYHYLPIGGSFTRNYVINNLENLQINFENAKNTYLHLDLSDTDNDDLMIEILFKLIILRYLNSNDKIFYLGYNINIIIEIPQGFVDYLEKYKLLSLFKKVYIDTLKPLRLEENAYLIKDSPISIVAEVLSLYDNNKIGTSNLDLNSPISKSAKECEEIINRHFKVDNQNYYQKMNFIKILSVQFKKFLTCIYFDYETAKWAEKGDIISKARVAVVKNFIELTKVFTQSPFDTVLLKQINSMKIFGKYDEDKAINDGIMALADENEKKKIFSFEQIKPSLVFFNQDGQSLSIISNNNKNDQEYKDLKALWNSQNQDQNKAEELIDYKNMKHEAFLEQVKKLFSLDKMSIDELKKLCEKLGNYIFVSDNFIKMVRILLNIQAKIPVILMGETGVGKTKLLEMLATLYGQGTLRWERLQIHAGTTDQKIVSFIDEVNEKVKNEGAEKKITWIFFDEINTCNSLGLITEIMCNHTYLGKKINENFVFLGACNPYRILTKKMRESGLVYYNMKEKNKLNNLVYTVNPLPHALLNFVFDFASLQRQDEIKYISNTIESILTRIKRDEIINDLNENDKDKLREEIVESISICHDFIREKYDKSSVSMREIRRFGIFFEYFINHFRNIDDIFKKMKASLNMTLYLCYYLRLNDKEYRKELAGKLNKFYKGSNFLKTPENEIKRITKEMSIEKGKGIALNRALRENLFTCYICIDNTVPLIIVGKPGTGKSLSFQILYNTLKGEYSESKMFRDKGKLYRYYYQGSETSTAEGIEQVFEKALKAQIKNKENKEKNKNKKENKIITLVFFDEMGLAERSSNNPLKVIHYLLEKDREDSVPFLGISNWRLDAAKINRALSLTITDYDIEDLEDTAISISESLNVELSIKYRDFFETLARTYNNYIIFNQNSIRENKDFHGNRDFYNLIKTAMRELIERRDEIDKNERRVLTEVGLLCLNRNFGGLEGSSSKIIEIFKKEYGHKFDEEVEGNFSVLDAIKKNVLDSNSRYLMLISEGNDGSDIIKYLLDSLGKKYILLVGSKYKKDIKSGRYSEEILNKIKYIMETENILILRDLDMIYASLYDLFNQNFTCMGDKKFARIAFETARISSEVNKNFHCIVIVDKNQIKYLKLDPPFLNRFEKHIVNFKILLEKKDIEIAQKIYDFIELISSFNNEKKLKIDLEKLLVNCKLHNIEGLIFKIKNNLNENEELLKDDNPDYENTIIKEVLKRIVPTFCQDILASLMSCKFDQKYKYMSETIIEIYKQSFCNNFEVFFKRIESKRNIIYTFSKSNEDLFKENQDITNKYGVFNNQSTSDKTVDSIKAEEDLIFILKEFINEENKQLLILRFSENDLNKMNSVNYVINNYQKENPLLAEKIILFVVHKQRFEKDVKLKKIVIPDLIPLINYEYNQIFIDNLQGRENLDVFKIMQKKNEELAKEYIENSNFIESKIFEVLNYMKYTILFETKKLNLNNYTLALAEKIINNDSIKQLIKKNLKAQGKTIKGIIKDVFTTGILEVNDVDFFEVINSKLSTYFISYLLKILYFSLKENILNQILFGDHLELLMQNDYFKDLLLSHFENTKFSFNPPIKMKVNANKITIYNGLAIPKSKLFLDQLIKYVNDDISQKYIKNEGDLRKAYKTQEIITEKTKNYYKNYERFIENLKIEINKHELLKIIFVQNNEELKKLLFDEYLNYYTIRYLEKKEMPYLFNERILSFLKLIIKIKISEKNEYNYDFQITIEEFIKIIIFTQGYNEDIKNLIDTFVEMLNYCENIEEYIINVLKEDLIKYEISPRNKKYTKIVNLNFFIIIEAFLRATLLFSIDLLKKDKAKFYEFLYSLSSIEANLQKINKKFFLYSKEICNFRNIIKIQESYKNNAIQFENNYDKIILNLLQQSVFIYNDDYNNLYNIIIDLNKIFDQSFPEKTEEYVNLLFYIFRQQYKAISNEDIRIKLTENFFQNKLLIKKSKIFLTDTLRSLKPEIFNKANKEKEPEALFIKNFMNLDENKKLVKFKQLINIFNKIDSEEFDELLLYFFESQCQSYFEEILKKNNYQYTQKSCEELLLNVSLSYLKKAIQFLYENKNNKDNNLLKLYAIAYLKSYCYYYVEINYSYFDLCNFEEINKVFNDKDDNNQLVRNLRNIYIWRLYFKKFENFEQFKNFEFHKKNIPIYIELSEILKKEEEGQKNYIFQNSFISEKYHAYYQKILPQIEQFVFSPENNLELNFEEVNNNFDSFYCILINKIISYLYSNEKEKIKSKLKYIYEISNDKLKLNPEAKTFYNYLLNDDLFQNEVVKKISDAPLNQEEFEILLYSLRFIFNIQLNNKSFYNNLLKKNAGQFIKNNYIPGSFQPINYFVNSYNYLSEELQKKADVGYYVCKDCGFPYEIPRCTFPNYAGEPIKDPNGHMIYGHDHVLIKLDIRVFLNQNHLDDFRNKYSWPYKSYKTWHDSFQSKTLEEFKAQYVDKFLKEKHKGIIEGYTIENFEKNDPVRKMNNISFRVLNFILYSFLMFSYILNNLSNEEVKIYLVENLFPHTLFGIVKKGWELLNISLKNIGIENAQTFMNMIFEKIIEIMEKYDSIDTEDKFENFENEINDYIIEIIKNKQNIENLNKNYQKLNNDLLSFNPHSMKEIIQGKFEPSIYEKDYPDIKYYSASNINNYNSFINKFKASEENKKNYALINILINKESELTQNAINMKSLSDINNITNLLLHIYSFKISREDAKIKKLKDELTYIKDMYNEINPIKLETDQFIKKYIEPFIKSWDLIKKTSIQYKCRVLRDLGKGEKPLEMNIDNALCYFLTDDGDKEGGMFLAAAYQNYIIWQNNFINEIISKNDIKGILNSYVSKLEQEILVQEATKDEIINIDDNIYKSFLDFISTYSMRNIFDKNNKINYKNYNDIKYDYESIEEELGKIILPGLKKFKIDKIKFISYLFEGFRGGNSSILVDYNTKYIQRELSDMEKESLSELLENNNSSKFYNDVFASLQILMNEIIKENYAQNHSIYKIIESLPNYIILNDKLIQMFKSKYEFLDQNSNVFTINSLVSIFEYFESLCWNEIKKNILPDYQLELSEEAKKFIINYFEKNNNEDKIINIKNFTTALRRLIARSLAGSRQETDIKSDSALKLYIFRYDLWPNGFVDNDAFEIQIFEICRDDILIGNCWNLYNILDGDNYIEKIKKKDDNKNIEYLNNNLNNGELNAVNGENNDNINENREQQDEVNSDDEIEEEEREEV